MATNPELKWDQTLPIGDISSGGMICGQRWYTDFTYIGYTNEFITIPQIRNITCPGIDLSVNVDYASAYTTEPILEFSNGAQLVLKLWKQAAHDNVPDHVKGEAHLVKHGSSDSRSLGAIPGWVSGGFFVSADDLRDIGFKAFACVNYIGAPTQQGGGVLEDITPADDWCVYILMPFMYIQQGMGYTHTWNHIEASQDAYIMQLKADPDADTTLPRGFWYSNINMSSAAPNFMYAIFSYDDIDDMKDDLDDFGYIDDKDITGDPYKPGEKPIQDNDPSGPGGGGGTYDPISDPVDFPTLPTNSAIESGAIVCFVVDQSRVTQVFQKLWNTNIFDIANFQKLLEAPLDSLVSLQCIPIIPTAAGGGSIQLGNFDTEVSAPIVTQQYYTIDCGTLKIPEFWGSALDYSPYTKFEIYLPFIGFRDVQIDDVMKTTLHLKYTYDILTGNMIAHLKCGQSVLYKWPGNVKQVVPVSARVNDALERLAGGLMSVGGASSGGGLAMAAIGAAINVAMSKTHVSRSGEVSGSTGLLDDFTPYVVIHRPIQSLANNFKAFKGYPSNITAVLNTLTGYTEVEYIHLTGIAGATDAELLEIEQLLKKGVLL